MFTPHHVSHVMCHISYVTSHMSHVMRPVSHFKFFLQSVGEWECQWRVLYQRGLPRLVSSVPPLLFSLLLLFSTNKYTSKTSYQIHVYKKFRRKERKNGVCGYVCSLRFHLFCFSSSEGPLLYCAETL